jgi:hypothetical protein
MPDPNSAISKALASVAASFVAADPKSFRTLTEAKDAYSKLATYHEALKGHAPAAEGGAQHVAAIDPELKGRDLLVAAIAKQIGAKKK